MADTNLKKLRCKKQYGVWYYEKEAGYDLTDPIYNLYNSNGEFECTCGCYEDMKYYVETGILL